MTYNLICGAEIHIELKTKSKMFCGCKNDPFGADKPNIYTCPVCLGFPGALPVPNKQAIQDTILVGLALHCEIATTSKFDRKHYFYPDLPKAYQISQYDEPLCFGGYVDTSFGRVGIARIHLEEDTAKLQHAELEGERVSLIDYNRSSVPLMEIVTEPDIHSPEQAKEFLKKVRDIVRALGVSDCDMEKGSMRLEANISLSPDDKIPLYKIEVKNINSFRFFALSLEYESKRQAEILDTGEFPKQETRGWRESAGATVSQRSKENAQDYRYFPEPDIPPLEISQELVAQIKERLPLLPEEQLAGLIAEGIPESAAAILIKNEDMMTFVEQVKKMNRKYVLSAAKDITNKKVDYKMLTPEQYIKNLESKVTSKITDELILNPILEKVLSENAQSVADYKAGKTNALGFLIGQIMKSTGGKADTSVATNMIKTKLE